MDNSLALYFHWPFCESKCPYCDFNSHVRDKINHEDFEQAYFKEIKYYDEILKEKKIDSIFFGGGTPSLMRPKFVEKLIEHLSKNYNLNPDKTEITLEANPSSSEAEKFKNFKSAGINRASIGVQSFDDKDLKFLGRKHSSTEAIKAIEIVKNVFENFSFDLIYSIPNQTTEKWLKQLDIALSFDPNHISCYQLTIEKGTEFFKAFSDGKINLPEEEIMSELYDLTDKTLSKSGLNKYEISNYAKEGYECKHNLNYWNYNNYLGIGAGAHSRINKNNKINAVFDIHSPEKWLESFKKKDNAVQSNKELKTKEVLEEIIFMGLRLKKGLNKENFKKITGSTFEKIFENKNIQELINNKMLVANDEYIYLTEKGLFLHTAICKYLIRNTETK